MSKSIKYSKTPPKARSLETLAALLHCKGGAMRDRRERRPKDYRNSWRAETREEDSQ